MVEYDDPHFPLDTRYAFEQFMSMPYFRVLRKDGEIVSWIVCGDGTGTAISRVTGMTMLYYQSKLKGVAAVKSLISMHQAFFEYVERRGLQIACASSVLPNSAVFERVLIGAGWSATRDRRLVRLTKFHPLQSGERRGGPPGTQVMRDRRGAETA